MDPARWEQVQALFHRAADLKEPERGGFLRETCAGDPSLLADVRRMLQEDAQTSLLDRDVTEVAAGVFGDALIASFQEFSPYRIKNVLGEGGMGVVYLAERKDLGNEVAIKILRDGWLSPSRRERFTAEQRTLAQLNHPSIARLYDANTLPDGTPWFVMEYVEGVPITDYCRTHNSSPDERVKLVRAVAEAVQYAHSHGIIHRDLKPSNILVKADGSLRLLDFGIAKQLDTTGQPVNPTRTAFRPMTPAYASPEQLRGEPVGVASDVYSLGVVLYELLAGKLPAAQDPTSPTRVRRLDRLCLAAIEKEPARRYPSMRAFVADIDHYLNREPLETRSGSWPAAPSWLVRRNSVAVLAAVAVLAVAALALGLSRKTTPTLTPARTVAVLPFLNGGADASLDYLSQALPDEISRALEYARSLSLRPTDTTRKYTSPNRDLQKVGRELHVATVVSGRYLKAGDQLQVTLDVTDVESDRLLWSDVFDFPAENMVAMQAQIAVKTRRSMAPVLGVSEFVSEHLPKPNNDEAYQLFLRASAIPADAAASPEARKQAMEMLNQSLALDPTYGPAWMALGSWYTMDAWFGSSGAAAFARWCELADKAVALDPDNFTFRAHMLYLRSLVRYGAAYSGGISRGQAYRELQDLLRLRPDSARVHFMMSWLLRDTGLLEESAHECETSILIDAQEAGARSCGVTFLLRGEYQRALDYLRLDPSSEVSKSVSIDVLVREGKPDEALQKASEKLPQWGAYNVLLAYLQHRPTAEIATLAGKVETAVDPEVNYFSAAHLAYAGQPDAALAMLKRTIDDGYCAYPGIDSDPLFAGVRAKPAYAEVRTSGLACQNKFLAEREQAARPR